MTIPAILAGTVPGWPELSIGLAAALAGVALLAGLVRGFSGFGAGLVMAPAFAVLIGPAAGVPVMILLEAVATGRLLPGVLPEVRARTVLTPGVTACLLVPVGALALTWLDGALLTRLISLAVLAFVLLFASGWRYPRRPGTPALIGVGALSGLLTGAAGIGGPPMVVLVLSGPDAAARNRANLIAYFGLTQTVTLGIFAVQGLLAWSHVGLGLGLGIPFLAGIQLGALLFRAAGEHSYRGAVLVLLAAIAAMGLASAG
ncbi:MAG: sulfite exporter TauE/SafE family protein [Acidobacteriota bacterium]|jgi:uncharacterized membrane protein YfcA